MCQKVMKAKTLSSLKDIQQIHEGKERRGRKKKEYNREEAKKIGKSITKETVTIITASLLFYITYYPHYYLYKY